MRGAGGRRHNGAVSRGKCLIGVCVSVWMAFNTGGGGDFNEFYAASKLAGTGHIYDWSRIQKLELRNGAKPIPFERLPVYAVLLKPLTTLPDRKSVV